jgi:hypothetical protein
VGFLTRLSDERRAVATPVFLRRFQASNPSEGFVMVSRAVPLVSRWLNE